MTQSYGEKPRPAKAAKASQQPKHASGDEVDRAKAREQQKLRRVADDPGADVVQDTESRWNQVSGRVAPHQEAGRPAAYPFTAESLTWQLNPGDAASTHGRAVPRSEVRLSEYMMRRLDGRTLQSLSVVVDDSRVDLPGQWVMRRVTVEGSSRLVAEPRREDGRTQLLFMVGVGVLVATGGGGVAAAALGEKVLEEMAKAYITTGLAGIGTLAAHEAWLLADGDRPGSTGGRPFEVVAIDDSLMTGEAKP